MQEPATTRNWITRRRLLLGAGMGFGGAAIAGLLNLWRDREQGYVSRKQHKSVIFLYMEGGPSHVDTFDPKPSLQKRDGEHITLAENRSGNLMRSPYRFDRYGESGASVSEIFPNVATCVDELAIVRSMVSSQFDHGAANFLMNTGSAMPGRPNMGAWILYGLGSASEELPGFIVLGAGRVPAGGSSCLGCGFLPAKYQSTLIGPGEDPVANLRPLETSPYLQVAKLELINQLNSLDGEALGTNDALEAVIASHEVAFRMQSSVPELLDFSDESRTTLDLYGINDRLTETFGTQCLRARRLVERGVRFVQLLAPNVDGTDRWDQHGGLERGHRDNATAVDMPIAGLIKDLRARGLLDDTLVVWGGEFGRSPFGVENVPGTGLGRNHNPTGFTMWLAGGGVRRGIQYGATDEFGYAAVDQPVEVHDLHATILHLLGFDHKKLTYRHGGRDFRLTDVYGRVIDGLVA